MIAPSGAVGNTGHVRLSATIPCSVAHSTWENTTPSADVRKRPADFSSSSALTMRCIAASLESSDAAGLINGATV